MGVLNSYLRSIMTVGICAFICETLSIRVKGSETLTKGLSLITSICIFLTVITPIFTGLKSINISSLISNQSVTATDENHFLSLTATETEKTISEHIHNVLGIELTDIDVKLFKDDEEISISEITIKIDKKDTAKEQEIASAIKEAAGNNVKVTINANEEAT